MITYDTKTSVYFAWISQNQLTEIGYAAEAHGGEHRVAFMSGKRGGVDEA